MSLLQPTIEVTRVTGRSRTATRTAYVHPEQIVAIEPISTATVSSGHCTIHLTNGQSWEVVETANGVRALVDTGGS